MIKKFNEYINEGIRDMMTPKSSEELSKAFDNLSERELAIKELQAMQSIMLCGMINSREFFSKTDIDCNSLFDELNCQIFYISTGSKSVEFGLPPRIEAMCFIYGNRIYYVDIDNKFLGRQMGGVTEIITTFESDYRDKISEWNDMTVEEGIDTPSRPSPITLQKFKKWFGLLEDMFNDASYIRKIESGQQIPELG